MEKAKIKLELKLLAFLLFCIMFLSFFSLVGFVYRKLKKGDNCNA